MSGNSAIMARMEKGGDGRLEVVVSYSRLL